MDIGLPELGLQAEGVRVEIMWMCLLKESYAFSKYLKYLKYLLGLDYHSTLGTMLLILINEHIFRVRDPQAGGKI